MLKLQVSHSCAYSLNSLPRPPSCQGTSETDCGGQMGGSPKAPTTASGRGNQPAGGDPESNRGCPGFRDIKRDGHNRLETSVKPALSISSRARVQSQPRSSPRRGNGRSRAQWERSRSGAVLAAAFLNTLLAPCCPREDLHRHLDGSILPTTCVRI